MVAQFHLRSIRKSYGTKLALDLDELTIWPARLYTLTGPNGSGKSTLLSVLGFLEKPEQGEVLFGGERVNWTKGELNLLRRHVTLVHQSPYLFSGSVFSNIAFGLKTRAICREEQRPRVCDALAAVGLTGFETRDVRQLSGGEARRIALARALVLQPDVLLLDEPLANLDEESTAVMENLIRSLPGQGTTVVMATHDLRQEERLESDVIRLLEGRLEHTRVRPDRTGERHPQEVSTCRPLKRHAGSSSPTLRRWAWNAWRSLAPWGG